MVGYLGDEAVQVLESVKDFYTAKELRDAIAKCDELKVKIDQHVGMILPNRKIDWEKAYRFIRHKTGGNHHAGGINAPILVKSAIMSGDVNIFNLAVDIILLKYDINALKGYMRNIDLSKVINTIRERIYELELQ
jgi:hypothetical protein